MLADIDFSQWDLFLSLYVIPDHYAGQITERRPLIAIRLFGVRDFAMSFPHHDLPYMEDAGRLTWNIYNPECLNVNNTCCQLVLRGGEQFPLLSIKFESLEIDEIDPAILKRLNPGLEWTNGLARPSLEVLSKMMIRRRGKPMPTKPKYGEK